MNDFSRVQPTLDSAARVSLSKRVHESPLAPRASGPVKLIFWSQWSLAAAIQVLLLIGLSLDKSGEMASHYRMLAVVSLLVLAPPGAPWSLFLRFSASSPRPVSSTPGRSYCSGFLVAIFCMRWCSFRCTTCSSRQMGGCAMASRH